MSSRHHQSPVLLEQSVSPPHFLSPELLPGTVIPPPTTSSQTLQRTPPEMSAAGDSVSDNTGSVMDHTPTHVPTEVVVDNSTQPAPETDGGSVMQSPQSTNAHAPGVEFSESSSPTETVEGTTGLTSPTPETTEAVVDSSAQAADTQPTTADATDAADAGTVGEEATPENNANEASAAPTADGETPVSAETEARQEPEPEPEPEDTTPSWVKYEEDLSSPDEDELKEIEESECDRHSATDISLLEEQFFPEHNDSDQRPAKKLRMSWVIKGVRGTRERPNMAKVMNSPAVCVNGMYWSVKFYPRGDNCGSLSAFVRCSRLPPKQTEEMPEHSFAFFEGKPDADFSKDYEPSVKVSVPNTQRIREPPKPKKKVQTQTEEGKEGISDQEARSPSPVPENPEPHEDDDEDTNDSSDDLDEKDLKDWRVSAQLGMTIYNPIEPRTAHFQSDGHQFSQHCDDWGWVNFVGPWDEIHKRKRGQRRPLLQNDTLAIDAYVRIFDDPTEALWWHESKVEGQWPSKQLAGFYPMGTPALYHSPAVAGITAWTILAPFRRIIQDFEGGQWLRDSALAPKPLVCQTQLVLQQMRHLTGECYVSVFKIIEELMEADEPWEDVKSFWEVYRRGLELELKDDVEALRGLSKIFDADGAPFKMPLLSIPGDKSVASGLKRHFTDSASKRPLPNFMPVMLNRQKFDKGKREWVLHEDRIALTDELDLSEWCSNGDAKYTLYGFVAHVNGRTSGKFYTVLRPGGIHTKWLAFEDGNGNKVFSYTKKRVAEFEGLEGEELQNFSGDREKAYMAMYVRNSCWDEYLPKTMEPYCPPKWLRSFASGAAEPDEARAKEEALQTEAAEKRQQEQGVQVELYLDETINGCVNMLELHDLRSTPGAQKARQVVMVAMDRTCHELRSKIAEVLEISDLTKLALWDIHYHSVGRFSRAHLEPIPDRRKVKKYARTGEVFRIWVTVMRTKEETTTGRDLSKITSMGLEKKALVAKPSQLPPSDEATQKDGSLGSSNDNTSAVEPATDESNNQPADTSSSNTEDSVTTGIATPATGETGDSAPDAEQATVEAAVAQDVAQASATDNNAASETQNASSTAQSDQTDTVAVVAEASVPTAMDAVSNPIPDTPLEHNHLVEAANAPEPAPTTQSPETTVADGQATTTEVAVLSSDEISPEDAAAIAALLAADADADAAAQAVQNSSSLDAEPSPEVAQPVTSTNEGGTAAVEVEKPRVPTPPIVYVYGFLHTFDAERQRFVAQKPFHARLEQEIGEAVRQALDYAEDKEIRIWKRDGPTGTASVSVTGTFANQSLNDGFTLLIGDSLPESRVEELKKAGKFWQPAQLIKYLVLHKRRHPIFSTTSTDPVEINEFGGEYFKGPIINGQPHGEKCLLITANGHSYEGPLIAGLKSGSGGKMTYQNGDTYDGGWLNDECHGQGEHIEARTGNRYVGGFENGKRWGEGITYWKVASDEAAMCQVCYGEEIDALFYDCGHVCACVECAKQCEHCPICRKAVRQVVKMYRA